MTRRNASTALDINDSEPPNLSDDFYIKQSSNSEQEEDNKDSSCISDDGSIDILLSKEESDKEDKVISYINIYSSC